MVTPTLLNQVLPEQFPGHLKAYLTNNLSNLNQDRGSQASINRIEFGMSKLSIHH